MSNKIHPWLAPEMTGKFSMIPPELGVHPAFNRLTLAAQLLYIKLNMYKETEQQRRNLYKALKDYNTLYDLGMTDFDIEAEATPRKHTKYSSGYFVFPEKVHEEWGFTTSYVSKLKKQLIDNGFIRVVYGGKGRYNGWNTNETVYQFIDKWQEIEK